MIFIILKTKEKKFIKKDMVTRPNELHYKIIIFQFLIRNNFIVV
jgi:hypothetical protein